MTHLYIELNTGLTEEVNSSIISKLYELAISGDLDETSDLKGRLHSVGGYDAQVTYLNEHFNDLYITVDKTYIAFEDPVVLKILATKWGDGFGVVLTDTLSKTSIGYNTGLNGNKYITTFNELGRFDTIVDISLGFDGCTNLTSIDLSNISTLGFLAFRSSGLTGVINLPKLTKFRDRNVFSDCKSITEVNFGPTLMDYSTWNNANGVFENCTNLVKVSGLSSLTGLPNWCFRNCEKLSNIDVDFSKFTQISNSCFSGCKALSGQLDVSNITTLENSAFKNCISLSGLFDFAKLTTIGSGVFSGCYFDAIFRTTTFPTLVSDSMSGFNGNLYVDDNLLNDYRTEFSGMASRIYPISELPS